MQALEFSALNLLKKQNGTLQYPTNNLPLATVEEWLATYRACYQTK